VISVENQKIQVEVDGVLKEATILKIVNLDNREFAIYTIDNGNDTSDVFSSEIIKDSEGYDQLIDIEDPDVKAKILEIINIMFS